MDSDSPISRVERTFWTVWNYLTEAVNRFLRPDGTNIPGNDPNSIQESAVDNEPANCGHTEGEASRVDEEQPLATDSLLSSSRPIVAWELCTTDISLGPDGESAQNKASEESEGTREEQFAQAGNDDAGLSVAKDARAEEGENRDQKLCIRGQDETPEDDENEHKSLRLTGDAMSEDMEDSGRQAGAEKTERAMTLDGPDETLRNIQGKEADDKMQHEDLQVELRPITDLSLEEEDEMQIEEANVQKMKSDEGARKVEVELSDDYREFKGDPGFTSPHVELQMSHDKSGIVSVDELIVDKQEHVMAHRSESDKVEDAKAKESTLGAVSEEEMNEASNNQAIDEAPEQEDDLKAVAEDSQGEVLTVTLSEEVMRDGKTELHTDAEAKDNKLQTKTRETKDVETNEKSVMTTMHISVDERCFDKDQVEEEISSEVDNKESYLEIAASVTVRPEGETGQEMSGEFKNIPPRVCEGQVVVSQELNPPACEETQEGVPEYNNELVDENTTQRFLEDGDCEEIQGSQLPEEVESKEPESLQNSGTGADYSLVRERMEEEQEQDSRNSFDSVAEENAGLLQLTDTGLPQETKETLDENTTERFLEDGDCKEIQGKLPEEVENKEPESLQNSGTGADYSLVRERMEEEQEQDSRNSFDSVAEENAGLLQLTDTGLPQETKETLDENTTERFLEDGDCKEIQGKLPEEVENKEPESLQNSGTGADYLLVREHMEEVQESTQDIKNSFEENAGILYLTDAGLPQETEEPLAEAVTQESGHFLQEEKEELLVDFMKTGVEHSEKEFGFDFGFLNETTKEPQNGTEELLVEFEIDKGLCESKAATGGGRETFLEAEVPKMTETSFLQELVDAMNSEQNSNMMASLPEDVTEFGFLRKQSDETKVPEDVEMQDAGIDMEKTGYGVFEEEQAAKDGLENKDEMEILRLQEAGTAESELSRSVESLETNLMLAEAAGETMTAESGPRDWTLVSTEGMAMHEENAKETICGHQDVIDEEILDLWIQTALSEDSVGIQQQEEPEPGQQMEPANEEQVEIPPAQTEEDKDQLVDLVSDTEMSSSTVESGFFSLCELGTQSSETLKSAGSFQGIYDMLESISESADVSGFSAQPSKSLISMEETAEMGQSDLKQEESITDSGVTSPEDGHQNKEAQKERDEERVEPVETETGSQKEIDAEESGWKETKEADGIKHADSGRSRSGSEVSEIVSTESGSQVDNKLETKFLELPSLDEPQPTWSEDIAETLHHTGVGGAEQLMTKSEDHMEVDAFTLDFTAQKSRIAVKNPHVRPPKDPRSLLHMPSLDPTPSSHPPVRKAPAGVPLGGLGIGIKLPGLGAGFPVLKKTQRVVTDENSSETPSQETKPEEKNETPKHDEAQHKPKWMPPKQPGFGNPLMSELKSKLKKTTKD